LVKNLFFIYYEIRNGVEKEIPTDILSLPGQEMLLNYLSTDILPLSAARHAYGAKTTESISPIAPQGCLLR
jgi:hypothetical protein